MPTIHLGAFWLALAFDLIIVPLAIGGWAIVRRRGDGRTPRLWQDRLILGVAAAVVVGIVSGLALVPTTGGPSDLLHGLYAAAALLGLPVVRYGSRNARASRRELAMAAGALVVGGVLGRLAMTGA